MQTREVNTGIWSFILRPVSAFYVYIQGFPHFNATENQEKITDEHENPKIGKTQKSQKKSRKWLMTFGLNPLKQEPFWAQNQKGKDKIQNDENVH